MKKYFKQGSISYLPYIGRRIHQTKGWLLSPWSASPHPEEPAVWGAQQQHGLFRCCRSTASLCASQSDCLTYKSTQWGAAESASCRSRRTSPPLGRRLSCDSLQNPAGSVLALFKKVDFVKSRNKCIHDIDKHKTGIRSCKPKNVAVMLKDSPSVSVSRHKVYWSCCHCAMNQCWKKLVFPSPGLKSVSSSSSSWLEKKWDFQT